MYTQVREVSARLRLKTGKINLIYQRFGILRFPIFAVIVLCLILSVVLVRQRRTAEGSDC